MTQERNGTGQAIVLIVMSSFGFGSLSTLALLTMRAGLPLIPAMFWRYLLAAVVLLLVLRSSVCARVTKSQALRIILIGALGQATITCVSFRALDYLPVGPLAFLFYTYPAWVALISVMTGREKFTLSRLLALGLAMAGIAVMVGTPSTSLDPRGVMLALGAALLYALYLPALHQAQSGISASVSTFYLILGVLLAFLAVAVFTRQLQMPPSLDAWKYLALLALVGTVIAFGTLMAGLRVLGPVRTSIVATIEPFFTALLGIVFLSEALTGGIVAGGAMIASAVVLLQLTGNRQTIAETAS